MVWPESRENSVESLLKKELKEAIEAHTLAKARFDDLADQANEIGLDHEAKFICDAGPPESGRRPCNPACVRCSLKNF
jgi:hypothetical protein